MTNTHVMKELFTDHRAACYEVVHARGNIGDEQSADQDILNTVKSIREQLNVLGTVGTDKYVNGTVLEVVKKFGDSESTYTYHLSKIADRWWITGKKDSYNWTQLLRWFLLGTNVKIELLCYGNE